MNGVRLGACAVRGRILDNGAIPQIHPAMGVLHDHGIVGSGKHGDTPLFVEPLQQPQKVLG